MKKRRFAAEDWLELGIAELSARGPEAIKLEAICKAAGLTRGSFYHHFADHNAFLVGVAEHWLTRQTIDVAAQLKKQDTPEVSVEKLNDAAMAVDYRLELGIREMGRRNADVAEIVQRADNMRLSVLADLYAARFGLDRQAAFDHALLEYAAFNGLILINPDIDVDRQRALYARFDLIMRRFFGQHD